MEKLTILIADDHTLVRETWSYMLNRDPRFEVVGETSTSENAVALAREMGPDVVIMDINFPGMKGIEATELIRECSPNSRVLGISIHTQPAFVRKMMQKGATGYVSKNSSSEEMIKAIIEVGNERVYICEEIRNILSDYVLNGDDQVGLNSLSRREIQVIGFIKKGYSSKEIAEELGLSIKTIEVHRYNILRKLNLKNSAAMVNFINNSQLSIEC